MKKQYRQLVLALVFVAFCANGAMAQSVVLPAEKGNFLTSGEGNVPFTRTLRADRTAWDVIVPISSTQPGLNEIEKMKIGVAVKKCLRNDKWDQDKEEYYTFEYKKDEEGRHFFKGVIPIPASYVDKSVYKFLRYRLWGLNVAKKTNAEGKDLWIIQKDKSARPSDQGKDKLAFEWVLDLDANDAVKYVDPSVAAWVDKHKK